MSEKHWADEFNELAAANIARIADLKSQLATAKAEIGRMRPLVEALLNPAVRPVEFSKVLRLYERSTKPEAGRKE